MNDPSFRGKVIDFLSVNNYTPGKWILQGNLYILYKRKRYWYNVQNDIDPKTEVDGMNLGIPTLVEMTTIEEAAQVHGIDVEFLLKKLNENA